MKKHKRLSVLKKAAKIGIRLKSCAPELLPECKVQIILNRTAVIEGCRGIAEYGEESISVNTEKGLIMVIGSYLSLENFEGETVVIKGKIESVNLKM